MDDGRASVSWFPTLEPSETRRRYWHDFCCDRTALTCAAAHFLRCRRRSVPSAIEHVASLTGFWHLGAGIADREQHGRILSLSEQGQLRKGAPQREGSRVTNVWNRT